MAKKNDLKASNYALLMKLLFLLVLALILGVVIVPFTPLVAGAPAWWVTTHGFFVDVRENIVTYAAFFALMLGMLFVGIYYFKKYISK